ncbi:MULTISPECIES: hypothetical protein [unclassified Acinetobacter]|uniref:hypothetical protein n=1 Tax=unclassified Acinetobacter TaxID=196816 RepID=UPI0015D37F72|nr:MULTISPECIES: hypothetical protein [unclassified Acinetobacter]UUS62513.1 hypothetical protein MST17_16805 [Acinetobacter sp. YH16056_T]
MAGLSNLKPGSMKGDTLELSNSKNPENGYTLDFSKSDKELLNEIRTAINSGAERIRLNVTMDSEANLFKNAVSDLKMDRITPLKAIAQENSGIANKLKTIGPIFGNRLELNVLDVPNNQAITNWRDVDKLNSPTEKQYLTAFESRLKQAWEKGTLNPKELIALSGNHQNASLLTGQKIEAIQAVKETPKTENANPKKLDPTQAMTPSQLEAERKKVFSLIESFQAGNDVKVMKPKPGVHDGFIVGVTDHFVVQRLGAESRYFMVHDKVDLPTAKVDLKERVKVHRNEQGQSKIENFSKAQDQNKSMGLKR